MINTREIAMELRLGHWAGIMQDRKASGMSISGYCETRGIHKNVYFYWQRKIREATCQRLLPETQTQLPKPSAPVGWALCEAASTEVKAAGSLSVEIGKFKVRLTQGDDMELFTQACRVLVSLC